MMGILSIKKRHRHRLSIQSVFPLIRKKNLREERDLKSGPLDHPSLEPELVERDEPAPRFITFEPNPPTRDGIPEPKQLR